jgi:hypothetical protein
MRGHSCPGNRGCQWKRLRHAKSGSADLGAAALVLGFQGQYRLYLAFRGCSESDESTGRRRGLYAARASRTHPLIGSVYVLLGIGLIATTFGWNPPGGSTARHADPAEGRAAETSPSVPIDPPQKR